MKLIVLVIVDLGLLLYGVVVDDVMVDNGWIVYCGVLLWCDLVVVVFVCVGG